MESPLPAGEWLTCTVVRVIDGDTFRALVDVPGLGIYPTSIRLHGINAPERRGPTRAAGARSFLRLVELLTGKFVEVAGVGEDLDVYGRAVCEVRTTPTGSGGLPLVVAPTDVASVLVSGEYARPWAA